MNGSDPEWGISMSRTGESQSAPSLAGMVTVPARDLDHLIQDHALALLRRCRVGLHVLLRDLIPGRHRQLLRTHTPIVTAPLPGENCVRYGLHVPGDYM